MATDIRALLAYLGTDAEFRAWGAGTDDQITDMGLVLTSDTGQIDFTTVARPAVNTFAGFKMYRFNDSLQGAKPVFVKMEYGIGSVADRPSLAMTVGTGTNGAGTLTGQVGSRMVAAPAASKTTTVTLNSYCSGSTSRLSLTTHLDPSTSTFAMGLFVERPRNAAGVEQGDCIVYGSIREASSQFFGIIPYSGSVPAAGSLWPSLSLAVASGGGVSVVGLAVALSPMVVFAGKVMFASWLTYLHADIGELVSISADHLGASHAFLPMGDGIPTPGRNQASVTGHSYAMLWE